MMAAMPPMKAYSAHKNASRSEKEPNTSIKLSTLPRAGVLQLLLIHKLFWPGCYAAVRMAALHAALLCVRGTSWVVPARSGFILGSTLRLHVLGDEAAFGIGLAFDKGLGFIDESVWKRVAAYVGDGHGLALFDQNEFDAAGEVVNAALLDGAGNAHAASAIRAVQ